MITNIDVYLAIAEEAHAEMVRLDADARTPKPDGSPGFVVKSDPERKSFKQALITIAFSGMYYEALIYTSALKRFGKERAASIDKMLYESRLKEMGINEQSLLESAELFRKARKDLVHEKAVEPADLEGVPLFVAQSVASEAIVFICQVRNSLQNAT